MHVERKKNLKNIQIYSKKSILQTITAEYMTN